MSEDNANERAVKPEDGKKLPKPRRTGQRETIVAGKKYLLRVFLGRDAAGKRHYHSEVFHGGAGQAEDRIREIIRPHRAGEALNANADTSGAFLDEWLEAKKLSVAESSLETYSRVIESRIRPAFGKKLLARVTADEIQRFYNGLHADGMNRSSIHFVHVVLGMIFKRRRELRNDEIGTGGATAPAPAREKDPSTCDSCSDGTDER